MNQILSVWDALDPRKRVVGVLATIAVIVAVLGLARMINNPSYALLYAGLDPSTSGEIVTALEGRNVPYEVRGSAIYVDTSRRDEVRMALAGEGLPANGVAGYELLDNLSGFGTTAQMFDAAYWRAKEGELARTILASPQVRSARVHISNTRKGAFGKADEMTASVIVTMGSGTLGARQAKAMRFLVASAVAGMAPEQVSVIDSAAGIVLAAGSDADAGAADDVATRTASMRSNIERLIAARVGAGNVVVEVNIDADMNSETTVERVLDPEGRVAISSDVEEKSSSASGSGPQPVTVASNLPDGDVNGGDASNSNDSLSRERVNYEVSEVRRERVKVPGEIRRISVAVLVDGTTTTDAAGETVWAERDPQELASLKELVQSAIGYDAARGDVVTISSMQFTAPPDAGTVAEAGSFDFLAVNAVSLLQMAFLGIVAMVLGLFVIKPILTTQSAPQLGDLSGRAGPLDAAMGEVSGPGTGVAGDGEIELNPEVLAVVSADQKKVEHLRQTIADRADDSKAILEDWLNTTELKSEEA